MSVGKRESESNITYNIKAVGNNIKWEKGEGEGNFGKGYQDLKIWGCVGNFIHP